MDKHFTTSVYILKEDQVLLIKHPKLKKWLPPGGHIEKNETPPQAARREVEEETGLSIQFLSDEHIWINRWNAKSFERPFLCLLEEVPPHGNQAAHQHIDLIYIATPTQKSQKDHLHNHLLRWFTLEEIDELESDTEIFAETQETLHIIMEKWTCLLK